MASTPRRSGRFAFLSEQPALDLVNTVDWRGTPDPSDRLRTYGDLVSWGEESDLLTNEEAARLRRAGELAPSRAAAALRRARELREAIHRLALATRGPLRDDDLGSLNVTLQRIRARPVLELADDTVVARWTCSSRDGDLLLGRIAGSAFTLFSSSERSRVRRCGSVECGWLFIDRSRDGTRRWCSMEDCGNREKARRHYARTRASGRRRSRTS